MIRGDDDSHSDFVSGYIIATQLIVSIMYLQVYYYDGNFRCFSAETEKDIEHLRFAVVALIMVVLVMLFPALVLLISFRRYKVQDSTSSLSEGSRCIHNTLF